MDDKFNTILNNNYSSHNVFELFDYNISKNYIFKIADYRIPLFNIYLTNGKCISDIVTSKAKLEKIILATNEILMNNNSHRNMYELTYMGITASTCDNLISKGLSIELLSKLSKGDLQDTYDIGNKMIERLKNAILLNDNIFKECNENIDTSLIMLNILKNNTIDKSISFFEFKKLLDSVNYNMNNYERDYDFLQNKGYIKNTLFGIQYKKISYFDFLKNVIDRKKYGIMIKRYEGKTLENIANDYGVTRERIRQIESKTLKRINTLIKDNIFSEDEYKNIYLKYPWNKKYFCEILDVDEKVYNYLKQRYKPNFNKEIVYTNDTISQMYGIVNDSYFDNNQINKFKSLSNIEIANDGTIIDGDTSFLKKIMFKYAQNEIKISDLCKIYNSEIKNYPELKLGEISERNIEGRIVRSSFAILGSNHKVRYYDYSILDDDSSNQLKELINIDDGFYSTDYLFQNNRQLMEEFDIRNKCELHNILKNKIDDENNNVYFIRMPNFLVGYTDKDDFLLDKIKEYSPISITDFVDIMYNEFGHKKTTMTSYLTSVFAQYIDNGYFNINSTILNDYDINKLKKIFSKDYYSSSETRNILKDNNYNDSEVLNNRNFNLIGYKVRGSYILKNKYSSIYNYLENRIKNDDIIKINDNNSKFTALYNAVTYYLQHLELFRLTDNAYITLKKLNELGITTETLNNFIDDLHKKFKYNYYFSVYNVIDEIDCSMFTNIGLSTDFIENIVFSLTDVKTLRINNNKLFSFVKNKMSKTEFMYDMADKYTSISLDDLQVEIYKTYKIDIPFDKLREYLYSTDIFYSDILEKIYIDKDDYYEEVYDE